ncbi:hypothetical protein XENTR_v10008041 [Xenopus tropicalis]|nr:hypothetical protein XENTR_v10008041 [Xenopus tropicalis]KAE8614214.1 hypothetical protein XENTR_v10008041 [Xenopus tropicalis]
MATAQGCENIRSKPGLQELFLALDTFRPEKTNFEAMIFYYEHHYRYFFGKMEDLEHFLAWYGLNHMNEENIPNYLVMCKHLKHLEILAEAYYAFYDLVFQSPTTQQEQLLCSQYEPFVILHQAVTSKLKEIRTRLAENEEELQELLGTSQQQHQQLPAAEEEEQPEEDLKSPAAEEEAQETPAAELEAAEGGAQETPADEVETAEERELEIPAAVVVEQLTLRKRVRRAITRQFQRIWRSTRSLLRGGCCHQPHTVP